MKRLGAGVFCAMAIVALAWLAKGAPDAEAGAIVGENGARGRSRGSTRAVPVSIR
jgi:hypothetical protein